jgi:hypothetical protein
MIEIVNKAERIQETLLRVEELEKNFSELLALAYEAPLDELEAAWKVLGDREHGLETAAEMSESLHQQLLGRTGRAQKVALCAMAALNGRLKTREDPSLLATSEFKGRVRFITLEGRAGQVYVLGFLSALPNAHPVRRLLPTEEAYHTEDGGALVLGRAVPVGGQLLPADWYSLSKVLETTRQWRKGQAQQEERLREEERHRQVEEEQRRLEAQARVSPQALLAELLELKREVAALKAGRVSP